ncbi:MAG: YraN family protein [Deltaproteobacteria bacterium RIFOXYD12_FULL_50_9]|nr:MAG: YraN family protein [Deltaproteobacteria bacterium RIFOXYD12_FULL_50_9]
MSIRRQFLGKQGETLACVYLKKSGYNIISTNYRCKLGEIDIIAEESGTLVFVEVKCRASTAFGEPYEAVTKRKMSQMSRVALEYMSCNKLFGRMARFDVVSIKFLQASQPEIELIRNAFDVNYGR